MKSFLKTASRAVAALFAVALVTMGVASPAFADGAPGTITTGSITIEHDDKPTGVIYNDLKTATAAAQSGDTIKLGEGNYTLYGVSSVGHTKDKDLTFEGLGTDKTAWNIGAEVPDPQHYDDEYNSDYSLEGSGTITFKNMTLRSGSVNYLGFAHSTKTIVDGCVINGRTAYWGYTSAVFKNTTFYPPTGDYALWAYSSKVMTFNNCTFNATGKVINVYREASTQNVTINVNDCTFNSATSSDAHKQALNINDSLMGNYKFFLNITGTNRVNFTGDCIKEARDTITCSQLFGFGGKAKDNNKGKTDVNINGDLVWFDGEKETHSHINNKLVWSASKEGDVGEMKTHSYTDGERDKAYDVTYTNWNPAGAGTWTRTGTPKCRYCGFVNPDFEEKAYDLSYDLNGSEDEQTFAAVTCVTEAEVTAEQPVRKGYSFVGWNTAKDGSGTSYAAGDKVELSAPVTLFAQWKKDEPAPKPSDNKPSDNKPAGKPANKTKASKQALPNTGDASANIVAAMGIMAIVCFVASAVVSKIRK